MVKLRLEWRCANIVTNKCTSVEKLSITSKAVMIAYGVQHTTKAMKITTSVREDRRASVHTRFILYIRIMLNHVNLNVITQCYVIIVCLVFISVMLLLNVMLCKSFCITVCLVKIYYLILLLGVMLLLSGILVPVVIYCKLLSYLVLCYYSVVY